MAPTSHSHKTSSTHKSAFAQGTHRFDIVGYSAAREALGGAGGSVRSGSFGAGGFVWALVCRLHGPTPAAGQCGLASISLELSRNDTSRDVVVIASLRIPERTGTGQYPAAVWRSNEAKAFRARSRNAVAWELAVPDALRDHESRYVDADTDCLTIHCTVDVLLEQQQQGDSAATRDSSVVVPPSPSISRDFHNLLRERRSPKPDVTFIVEDDGTEVHAHKLVLAMRSPVFAAQFFRGDMKERRTRRVQIGGMSASTLRVMLYFIYTDQQPAPKKGRCPVAMAHDLLVAADLYDLERLRLMCEKVLSERIDVGNVMATLMLAHDRHTCRQLEASCIEFMASHPDVYDAVEATEEYKELEKTCPSFINEVTKKVAKSAVARGRSPSTSSSTNGGIRTTMRSTSRYNPLAIMSGTHEFTIESLSAVRKKHGVGQKIRSGSFHVGGYEWAMDVYPSGDTDGKSEHIGVYVKPFIDNDDTKVEASVTFKPVDPTGQSPPFPLHSLTHVYVGRACKSYGYQEFITAESAYSHYMAHDGSFTIQCRVEVTTSSCTSNADVAGAGIVIPVVVPPSNLARDVERLLTSEEGWDVKFLVEESEVRAHGLVIAARSPALHETATNMAGHVKIIDGMRAETFRAMLHFIYTDELPPIKDKVSDGSGDTMIAFAGEMLAAACRFRPERMKLLCVNLLAENVTTVMSAIATVKMARAHDCPELEKYCKRYMLLPHVTGTCIDLFLESQLA